jgi:hypothetical protein
MKRADRTPLEKAVDKVLALTMADHYRLVNLDKSFPSVEHG